MGTRRGLSCCSPPRPQQRVSQRPCSRRARGQGRTKLKGNVEGEMGQPPGRKASSVSSGLAWGRSHFPCSLSLFSVLLPLHFMASRHYSVCVLPIWGLASFSVIDV